MKQTSKFVRIICAVIAAIMVLSLVVPILFTSYATSGSQLEAEAERLRQELAAIDGQISGVKNNIEKQQELRQYYTAQSNLLAQQIEVMKAQITETEATLVAKNEELTQKILDVEATKLLFEDRLVAMYKTHKRSQLSTLLGASTFAEAMRFAKNLQEISLSDTEMIEILRREQEELEAQKAEVEAMLENLNVQKADLETAKNNYAISIQAANSAITQAEADLAANQAAYAEKYAQWKAADDAFKSWIVSNNDSGDFTWGGGQLGAPIKSYTRISSDYGYRTIYGVTELHRGVDFAAPAGTPIYAAESGIVSTTGHWTYGTVVKISHGSGLVTIYAHMQARAAGITNGVAVTRGQLIGYVGSTGNSTGNHLHFEVNLNGVVQNPWNYLNG